MSPCLHLSLFHLWLFLCLSLSPFFLSIIFYIVSLSVYFCENVFFLPLSFSLGLCFSVSLCDSPFCLFLFLFPLCLSLIYLCLLGCLFLSLSIHLFCIKEKHPWALCLQDLGGSEPINRLSLWAWIPEEGNRLGLCPWSEQSLSLSTPRP